jgi:hypothetical protein
MIRSRPASGFVARPLEGAWRRCGIAAPRATPRLKPALSRFHPVRGAELGGQQRVDLTRSPRGPGMTALCAFRPNTGARVNGLADRDGGRGGRRE